MLTEWENNREAMLTFIEQTHTGVKGFVTEADGITPPAGVKGRHVEVRVRKASGSAGRYMYTARLSLCSFENKCPKRVRVQLSYEMCDLWGIFWMLIPKIPTKYFGR